MFAIDYATWRDNMLIDLIAFKIGQGNKVLNSTIVVCFQSLCQLF